MRLANPTSLVCRSLPKLLFISTEISVLRDKIRVVLVPDHYGFKSVVCTEPLQILLSNDYLMSKLSRDWSVQMFH